LPVYRYRGLTAGNQATRGMIDANSSRGARLKLREAGIFPTEISEGKTGSRLSDLLSQLQLPQLRRTSPLDLSLFTNQLATLIGAAIPIVESLAALTDQIENTHLKSVVGKLRESVNHGSSLGDAMAAFPHVFGELYQSMVAAGESAGALEVVLVRLAEYVEGQMELRNKVVSAMVYPLIMIVMSMAVMGVLMVKVIPTIASLLEDLDQPLPTPTRIIIALSDFFTQGWLPIVVGLAITVVGVGRALQTQRGRAFWDRLRLNLPVLGRVTRYVAIARFSRTLATLLAGGLNIVPALDISGKVCANVIIGAAIRQARTAITKGATISGPLRQSGQFPPMVIHMISVGEASGELDTMLAKVADTYDDLVENAINRLTTLMGPALLILVAGIVVMVILSTLLPLMSLTSAL